MAKFGFVGPTYASKSLNADAQRCINWYVEAIESGAGKGPAALYPTPGIKRFAFATRVSDGPRSPAAAVDDASSGTKPWHDPNNAEVSDDAYAWALVWANIGAPPAPEVSHYLDLSDFGFATVILPDATIFGIRATVEGHFVGGLLGQGILRLYLIKDGVVQTGTLKLDAFSSYGPSGGPDVAVSYGGPTDLWNANWPTADLISSGFGFAIQCVGAGPVAASATFYVDSVIIEVYYGTPLGGTSSRGLHTINDRVFAVVGPNFYELALDGVVTLRGVVADDGQPVSIAGGPTQLLIVSGGVAYSYDLTTDVLAPVVGMLGTPSLAGYSDGYFIVMLDNSQRFQISALLDATSWDPSDIAQVSVFPDNLVSMLVDHRELWLWGRKASQVYYDSGNPDFPWEVMPGAFIEQGCGAKRSPVRLDNSVFWLGEDERGAAVAWRASGYTPTRVSNHAVEQAWQSYSTTTDVVSYAYQADGHSFWVLSFPTAKATWVYDASTGMWQERGTWDPSLPGYVAHRSQCHAYAFGKHLVGDRLAPNIYEMSTEFHDEDGDPIRRMRRAPHISQEQEWIFHHQLQVDLEPGLALQVGQGSDPQIILRWSDDGAKTWSNQHWAPAGKVGEYRKRIIWRRLGRSRDRVYEIVVTDPIPWRIVDAYLKVST